MRLFISSIVFLSLAGCSGVVSVPSHTNVAVKEITLSTTTFVSGDHITISDPSRTEPFSAIVGQPYFSALGQECYRLDHNDHRISAVCKGRHGRWALIPSLNKSIN